MKWNKVDLNSNKQVYMVQKIFYKNSFYNLLNRFYEVKPMKHPILHEFYAKS